MSFIKLFRREKLTKAGIQALTGEMPFADLPKQFLQRNFAGRNAAGAGLQNHIAYTVPPEKEFFLDSLYLMTINSLAAAAASAVTVYNYQNTAGVWPDGGYLLRLHIDANDYNQIFVNYPNPVWMDEGWRLRITRGALATQDITWAVHGWERAKRW